MKKCIECDESKPLDDFPKAGGGYYKSRCKPCFNYYQAKRREQPEQKARIQRSWKKASAKYYTVEKRRNKTLRQYGLTEDTYNQMYDDQNGLCYICQDDLTLVVDHCHTSNRLRKLLCNSCNIGLGVFKDNPDILRQAALYIEEFSDAGGG